MTFLQTVQHLKNSILSWLVCIVHVNELIQMCIVCLLQLTEYYEVIQHPMALDVLKSRLQPDAAQPYDSMEDVVRDIRLIFNNCYEFNPVSGTRPSFCVDGSCCIYRPN